MSLALATRGYIAPTTIVDGGSEEGLEPVPAAVIIDDIEVHDHAAHAINRLCQYARSET